MSIYQEGLAPAAVNHMALSPLSFIERTAAVYPNYPAVIHGSLRRNWQETYQRCRRLASALHGRGIRQGDTVAAMLPNIPAMLECHFGVPMIGAVLNTLNVRLDAEAIAFMLDHGEARVLITDREFHDVIRPALELIKRPILVVDVDDPEYGEGEALSDLDYEAFLAEGDPAIGAPCHLAWSASFSRATCSSSRLCGHTTWRLCTGRQLPSTFSSGSCQSPCIRPRTSTETRIRSRQGRR